MKNLVASNNKIEKQILDYTFTASKMAKELDKMSKSLSKLENTQEVSEVSEVFQDLLEELSEVSYKGSIALDILSRFGK